MVGNPSADAARPMEASAPSAQPDAGSISSPADTGVLPALDGGGAVADTGLVTPGGRSRHVRCNAGCHSSSGSARSYVWGVGLGVTDLAAAVKFYTEVMKMTVEKQNVQREDRTETTLFRLRGDARRAPGADELHRSAQHSRRSRPSWCGRRPIRGA
jgi:hypothetical protein